MDLDEEGVLKSIFWSNGRSRSAYTQFGDVVVFDVTYKTNRFKMSFASFVGVNHHRQSILFGGALLVDETESIFTWLFEQFLQCIHDITPGAIITDQDKAMGNAIKKVFPNTRHRFCSWHINKHIVEHLAPFRAKYMDFNLKWKEMLKNDTIGGFESDWEVFRQTFNIDANSWLRKMYDMRSHWVKAYLNDIFFAGMTSSGRSESIHVFFDGYLNSNTMLNEFVIQYDLAVKSRRDAENHEDFVTLNTQAVLASTQPIEIQAGKCYTRAIFNIFQVEWKKSYNLFHEKVAKEGSLIQYKVGVAVVDQMKWRNVVYESVGDTFRSVCSCAKFQTSGILCKHILYILRKKCVKIIPKEYILDRWCIDARFKMLRIGSIPRGNETSRLEFWAVRARFNKAMEEARMKPFIIQQLCNSIDTILANAASSLSLDDHQPIRNEFICGQLGNTSVGLLPSLFVIPLNL